MSDDLFPDLKHHHVGFSVADIEVTIAFWTEVMGFAVEDRKYIAPIDTHLAFLRKGDARLEVFQKAGSAPIPDHRRAPNTDLGERLYRTFLPALTLTLIVTAHMMRMTRAAIINLLALPYIEMAHLKGMRQWRVIAVHALPNALAPIINVIALNLAYLIVGVVLVEVVFAYPGLGQLLVDSVSNRDVTVVQAACLIFAATYILLNLAADVLSIIANPQLLHPR